MGHIETKNGLDNALRYLYNALQYLEVPILAIRFQFNGEEWEADSVEEAIALRAKLEYATRYPENPHDELDKQERFWTPDRFMDVINAVGKFQHRLLILLYENRDITSSNLLHKLGLKSEVALAGVISGLSKQLRALEIEPKQVFFIEVRWDGKKKVRTFSLNDFFKSAAAEQNWPEAWTTEAFTDEPEFGPNEG